MYRNLALNPADQHRDAFCYPYASANVVTGGINRQRMLLSGLILEEKSERTELFCTSVPIFRTTAGGLVDAAFFGRKRYRLEPEKE